MEALNNMAGAVSKVIWGESKGAEEPVSGKQGAGTVEEPFDKSNEEPKADTGNRYICQRQWCNQD